jgi:nucleoside-diphosphate-sugar epimerase
MKVLLTGSTGFIGRYVAAELEAKNIEFVSISRKPQKYSKGKYVVADLLKEKDIISLIKEIQATHLIHLAWYTEHGKYWNSALNLEWMTATHRLIESFCIHGGQHVLLAGTCAEYDWRYGMCYEDITPTNPKTLYGVAKDATRRLAQLICLRHDVSFAWARIFFPYGIGEENSRLIPSLFRVFQQKQPPFGVNADSYRDFLHARDLAKAFVICMLNQVDGILNLSSGEPLAIREIVKIIAQIYGVSPLKVLDMESERTGEPRLLVGDNEKLKSFGWRPKIDIVKGLLNY